MARVNVLGWEANDYQINPATALKRVDGFPQGTGVSIDAAARTGNYCLKIALTSGIAGNYSVSLGSTAKYARVYIKVAARPVTTARKIILGSTFYIRLNPDGTLGLYLNAGPTLIGTSSVALTDTTKWYLVEWRWADGSSVELLKIDGVNQGVLGSPSSWALAPTFGTDDTVADTYTVYFDDYTDDTSAFPGPGKVVLLLPTVDSSVTGWTCGDGVTTTNLWEAVNNTPPAGAASAGETATTNIKSVDKSTTANYIATMQTYAAAGIQASDTINIIRLIVIDGEDAATGTKTGTFELTQNPVVAATAFTFGGDNGAHGAYNAASASDFWQRDIKDVASPVISNVATAPLMKVVKTDSGTRAGCICFMGIYVDYTPATVTASPKRMRAAVLGA